jgi:hypothetical protein
VGVRVRIPDGRRQNGCVGQLVESTALNPVKCRFDSDRTHSFKDSLMKRLLLIACLGLAGCCGGSATPPKPTRYDNVVRVMVSSSITYTIFIEDPGTKEITNMYIGGGSSVKIFADVPADKPMWAEKFDSAYCVHVHSGKDVSGAAQSGKTAGLDVLK